MDSFPLYESFILISDSFHHLKISCVFISDIITNYYLSKSDGVVVHYHSQSLRIRMMVVFAVQLSIGQY